MAVTPLPALIRTSSTFKADVDTFFATNLPTFSIEVNTFIASGPVNSVAGATGIVTAPTLLTALSLGNVDNTSDVNKPVSTAQAVAIALKQDLTGKDASSGYVGLTLFKHNFKNAANTFTSFFTNANTASRTYTFPDKDLTVAGLSDFAAPPAIGNTTPAAGSFTTLASASTVNFGGGGVVTDASGNLGLSATPSAWGSQFKVIESLYGDAVAFNNPGPEIDFTSNAYYNGANWIYKGTNSAVRYALNGYNGTHAWHVAASGTAGNPITFAQAMTLDNSGNLNVGQTTVGTQNANGVSIVPSVGAVSYNHLNGTTSGGNYAGFGYNGGVIGSITQSGTTAVLYNTTSDHRLKANQQPLTGSGAFIDALKPTTWEWTRDGRKDAGFLAHEFQLVCPNAVTGVKDEMEEQGYEVSPAVAATQDADGLELTPAEPAVMGTRIVPKYQAMQAGSAEVIANLVAELQSLRKRLAILESA